MKPRRGQPRAGHGTRLSVLSRRVVWVKPFGDSFVRDVVSLLSVLSRRVVWVKPGGWYAYPVNEKPFSSLKASRLGETDGGVLDLLPLAGLSVLSRRVVWVKHLFKANMVGANLRFQFSQGESFG